MAGLYVEHLALLVELDRLDQELIGLRAEQRNVPKAIAARQAQLDGLIAEQERVGALLDTQKKTNRDGERELELIERRSARARKRLDGLFVSSQIEATEKEIAALAEQKDEVEFAVLEGMEEADALAAALATAQQAVLDGQSELSSVMSAWAARSPEVAARLDELEVAQKQVVPKIHKDTLRMYMVGLENRQNTQPRGITRSDGINCTMCQTDLPVRWVNEARVGDGVHACLGCKRVLVGKILEELPEED